MKFFDDYDIIWFFPSMYSEEAIEWCRQGEEVRKKRILYFSSNDTIWLMQKNPKKKED